EELLRLAMESRKRVKDQLARIDSTYPEVDFHYIGSDGQKRPVTTVEEEAYPQFYHRRSAPEAAAPAIATPKTTVTPPAEPLTSTAETAEVEAAAEGHHVFAENRTGISYETLFGPYIAGATRIEVTDPYIRYFYQI